MELEGEVEEGEGRKGGCQAADEVGCGGLVVEVGVGDT